MVVACIALTVALGGTSVAAIQALPRNSVGAKQLKKNAVTGPKIRANAVNGAKVANNSLTGADVNEVMLAKVPSAATADNATNATNATNASNANTLDGIDSINILPGGTLPAGKTIRGLWDINLYATAADQFAQDSIPFGYKLPNFSTPHYIAPGATPPPECPGTGADPEALSGHFCLYAGTASGFSGPISICDPIRAICDTTSKVGAFIFGGSTGAVRVESRGSWAVTA
jgi:hypothetical protein